MNECIIEIKPKTGGDFEKWDMLIRKHAILGHVPEYTKEPTSKQHGTTLNESQ